MPQSLSSVYIHLVFSTKDRQPFLRDTVIQKEMHAYLGGVSKKLDCSPVIIGGVEDHVHLLCRLARTLSQADWVKEIKRGSNLWLKQKDSKYQNFFWQNGYAERLIGSIRRECLDHVIVFSEHHLRHLLLSYMKYYNGARTHLSLEKDAPISRAVDRAGHILFRPTLGGLHHQYARI